MRLGILICAFVSMGTSAPVAAQAPAATSNADDPRVAAADAEARGLYEAGRAAFTDSRFEDALGHFRRSYELSHRPALLYNIGLAAERSGRDADALVAYRDYLAQIPDAENRLDVEARVALLEHRTAGPGPVVAPSAGGGPDPAGIALAIAGGAVSIAGGVLLGVSAADQASLDGASAGTAWSSLADTADRIPIESGAGWVALAAGVACATVGVVLLATSRGASTSAEVVLAPTGIAVMGRF